MRVLVVDDDAVDKELLGGILTEGGHEVTTAGNGREAMELLRAGRSSVVISDWVMPAMDGLELCRAIRKEDLGRYVYVILLTGHGGARHMVEGLSAGADEFMFKPVQPA